MIVWLASYPRSGNTFLRIVLHRLYGASTCSIYDVDGPAERVGAELVGRRPRPTELQEMRQADVPWFVHTHRQRDDLIAAQDGAICLVRDGRDAVVSFARLRGGESFESELRQLISRSGDGGTGDWGSNVLSWIDRGSMVRYEELVADPIGVVMPVVATLVPTLSPLSDADIPSFAELQRTDSGFFRRGGGRKPSG